MVDPVFYAKAAYLLGISNIIGLLLVLISCRCTLRINKLQESKLFMKLYQYHCYYWWFFIISVLLHALLAIIAFGNPFF